MGLLKVIAMCLMVSQTLSARVEDAFVEYEITPNVVPTAPNKLVRITYNDNSKVNLGNELSVVTVAAEPKSVSWDAKCNEYYVLAMVDPDAPSRAAPVLAEIKHWLIVNIRGNNIFQGDILASYLTPTPPPGSGFHRYVFVLYRQPNGVIDFGLNDLTSNLSRLNFSISKFAAQYNLTIYAGNFFQARTL